MGMEESVLCIREELLTRLGTFEGLQCNVDRYLDAILDKNNLSFQPRSSCETDPSFKQLIPYVILKSEDRGTTKLFRYTRGSGQGEARLHAKQSIGIGGHISTEDAGTENWYRNGMMREIEEEIHLETNSDPRIVGLLYDGSNAVGQVHLGIVHLLEVNDESASAKEVDLCDAGWFTLEEIYSDADRLESWSQLCLQQLFPQ